MFAVGALLASSLTSIAHASGVAAVELGDISDVEAPQFKNRRLGGTVGAAAVWSFSLSEPKTVGLGLRRLDVDADLVLEAADGVELGSSRNAGTANEWLRATLLSGDYVIRAVATEAGENRLRLRYGVTEPDPVAVAELETAQTRPATIEPIEPQTAQQQQSEPGKDSDGTGEQIVISGRSTSHESSSDIVLDFGTVNLTGKAGNYEVSGLHMDTSHVYVLLGAPDNRRGIYKFLRSDGSYVNHLSLTFTPRGIAGSSNRLYVGRTDEGNFNSYSKSLVYQNGDYFQTISIVGMGDLLGMGSIGDVFTSNSQSFLLATMAERTRTELGDGLVFLGQSASVRNKRVDAGSTNGGIDVVPADMDQAGFTADKIGGIDLATDGSTLLFLENGDGDGALAFAVGTGTDVDERRNALLDADFGRDGFDGLFFDGDKLWTLDVDSFSASDDQFTLRAFKTAPPAVPTVDEVTSVVSGLVHEEETRGGNISFPDHDVDLDGDGTVDFTMLASGGFTPQGLWGDSDHLYVADPHTAGVYAVSLRDLIDNDTDDGSFSNGRSFGPGLLAEGRWNHRHWEGQGDRYVWVSAVWGDEDHLWISDDNNPWLRAHDRDTKQRVESKDILLYKDGHGFMALGIWSDGTTMWVNAMPYRWYPGRTAFSSGIYTVDLSTGDIERADGFEGLRDANGRRRSRGIWSDGETMWVAAPNGKIQAYDLDTGARRSNFDIATTRSGNGLPLDPGGLWSDGEYMFYGEQTGGDIHIYRLTS